MGQRLSVLGAWFLGGFGASLPYASLLAVRPSQRPLTAEYVHEMHGVEMRLSGSGRRRRHGEANIVEMSPKRRVVVLVWSTEPRGWRHKEPAEGACAISTRTIQHTAVRINIHDQ